MNARTYTIKLTVQPREVYEVLNGLLHTIFFYRSSSVGLCRTTMYDDRTKTIDFETVHCEPIMFHHVKVKSAELQNRINRVIKHFFDELQQSDMQRGSLFLDFHEKSTEMFIPVTETWEVWKFEVYLRTYKCERERYGHVDRLLETLTEAVSLMSTSVSSSTYAPVASSPEDIPRIYDTSFGGFHPYNFAISHKVDVQGQRRNIVDDFCKWVGWDLFLL